MALASAATSDTAVVVSIIRYASGLLFETRPLRKIFILDDFVCVCAVRFFFFLSFALRYRILHIHRTRISFFCHHQPTIDVCMHLCLTVHWKCVCFANAWQWRDTSKSIYLQPNISAIAGDYAACNGLVRLSQFIVGTSNTQPIASAAAFVLTIVVVVTTLYSHPLAHWFSSMMMMINNNYAVVSIIYLYSAWILSCPSHSILTTHSLCAYDIHSLYYCYLANRRAACNTHYPKQIPGKNEAKEKILERKHSHPGQQGVGIHSIWHYHVIQTHARQVRNAIAHAKMWNESDFDFGTTFRRLPHNASHVFATGIMNTRVGRLASSMQFSFLSFFRRNPCEMTILLLLFVQIYATFSFGNRIVICCLRCWAQHTRTLTHASL